MAEPSITQTSSAGVGDRGTAERGVSDRGLLTSTSNTAPDLGRPKDVAIQPTPDWSPAYHPGVMHDHQPSGRWDELRQEPNSDFLVGLNARFKSPGEVADAARYWELEKRPLAAMHFDHYRNGAGKDYIEDQHLSEMLQIDEGVMYEVGRAILSKRGSTSTVVKGFLEIRQDWDYLNEEFEYSFGSIDRLDYEADLQKNTLRVWFKDRYEWHPYYPKVYPVMAGDEPRLSNILHAAMVELKTEGASDFWMIGKAEVPLKPVLQIASRDQPPKRGAIGGDRRSEGTERTTI